MCKRTTTVLLNCVLYPHVGCYRGAPKAVALQNPFWRQIPTPGAVPTDMSEVRKSQTGIGQLHQGEVADRSYLKALASNNANPNLEVDAASVTSIEESHTKAC